jgi:2-methylcitrate dehydratase PrpD
VCPGNSAQRPDREPIAARLGSYVAHARAEAFSVAVREKAATCLLDGLALGMAAGEEVTTRALLASPLLSSAGDGCRVWADGRRAPLSEAVWLNGYAVHARFQDDCDMTSWTHPGSLVLPAAVSVAEAAGATLERMLTGIVCGYSVLHWLGAAEKVGRGVVARGFRASPTLGPVAAAAAAAAVLELSSEQAGNALAIAAASAGGVIETVRSGSADWRFQNGSAAWRGAMAALLAREGVDGAPEIFESEKGFVRAFAGLDEVPVEMSRQPVPESICTVWAKPYPILGDNVAVASAAALLAERSTFDRRDITAIKVHQNAEFAAYPGTAYRGPYAKPTQAIASTAFGVAAALVRGSVTFDLYSNALDDPEILSLIEKVTVFAEHGYGYLDGRVVVETGEGGEFSADTSEIPREFFYRDRRTATAAFAATLREVGIEGDATSFAERLLERVARDDTRIGATELVAEALDLREGRGREERPPQ